MLSRFDFLLVTARPFGFLGRGGAAVFQIDETRFSKIK